MTVRSIPEAKRAAKALRAALAEAGTPVSHSQALELIAQQNGARDWNTLHARLAQLPPFALHDRVQGRYLGQHFTGQIIGLAQVGQEYDIMLRLDAPVDTVRFSSFSNMRRQVRSLIGRDGRSRQRTSDGEPHLVMTFRPSAS